MPVFNIVGSPQSVGGANPGICYAYNNVTNVNNIPVAPANPMRRRITFINPGPTNIIYVSMTEQIDPIFRTQSALTPNTTILGGSCPVFPGGYVTFEGQC